MRRTSGPSQEWLRDLGGANPAASFQRQTAKTLAALICVLLVAGSPVSAQEEQEDVGLYETIVLTPAAGTVLSWNGRRYAGQLEVRSASDGLVVVERVEPEDYLLGIQEVPF